MLLTTSSRQSNIKQIGLVGINIILNETYMINDLNCEGVLL